MAVVWVWWVVAAAQRVGAVAAAAGAGARALRPVLLARRRLTP
jgi:hypothetical protein